MICVFCLYQENALRPLRALRFIFFILGGRRDFYNFLSNKKVPRGTVIHGLFALPVGILAFSIVSIPLELKTRLNSTSGG